jgi:hypothetical protein
MHLAQTQNPDAAAIAADDKARKEVVISSSSTVTELPEHTDEKRRNGNSIRAILKQKEARGNPESDKLDNSTNWTDQQSASKPICNGKNRGKCEQGTLA